MQLGIKPASSISPIKAGISLPGFTHILSFRRQLYIKPEDMEKLPESIQIAFEGTTYWIYISSASPICFICKEEGHLARQCKSGKDLQFSKQTINQSPNDFPVISNENISSTLGGKAVSVTERRNQNTNQLDEREITLLHSKPISQKDPIFTINAKPSSSAQSALPIDELNSCKFKRPISPRESTENLTNVEIESYSDSSSTKRYESTDEESILCDHSNGHSLRTPKKKTKKLDQTPSIEECILPIKKIIESSPSNYTLNFIQLKGLFENCVGSVDYAQIALSYTNDIEGLVETLHSLYPYYNHRSIKNRSSRIEKKLRSVISKHGNKTITDTSESSVNCQEMNFIPP